MKVAVVGLDGATWDLLDPWLEELPTIRRFAESVRGELDSCVPPLSVPAWKCYTTGMNPGDLGVYTFVEPEFENRRFTTVSSETFVHREVWDYLGDEGVRTGAINVPSTAPPREIPGYLVSGPFSDPDDYARPRNFQSDLDAQGYEILPDYYLSKDPAALDAGLDAVRSRFDAALDLREECEFLHVTIYLTDTVQHAEWDSDVSKTFWQDVDAELGRFVDELGDDWNVVLMSDHGFGKSAGIFYLNSWLEDAGYMRLERGRVDFGDVARLLRLDYDSVTTLLHRLRLDGLVRAILPSSFLLRVARQMPGNRKLEGTQSKLDWDSDALALAPLIYTKNREIAERIRADLLSLRDDLGAPIVDDVYFGADLYPDADHPPDLIVRHGPWDISDVVNPGTLFERNPEWKVAHHRRNGIISALGPDVEDVALDDARLYDLTPTILDAFGADVPVEMRGTSLGLLGTNGRRASVPVTHDGERVLEHDENVEQKLRDLGYL